MLSTEKKAYVAGLSFNQSGTSVALITKLKPAWQAGRLNAIGGKIEEGEMPGEAMTREFAEEAGVSNTEWTPTASLIGNDFIVYFFHSFDQEIFDNIQSMEEEQIFQYRTDKLLVGDYPNMMPNLRVIISIALDNTGISKPVLLYDMESKE